MSLLLKWTESLLLKKNWSNGLTQITQSMPRLKVYVYIWKAAQKEKNLFCAANPPGKEVSPHQLYLIILLLRLRSLSGKDQLRLLGLFLPEIKVKVVRKSVISRRVFLQKKRSLYRVFIISYLNQLQKGFLIYHIQKGLEALANHPYILNLPKIPRILILL